MTMTEGAAPNSTSWTPITSWKEVVEDLESQGGMAVVRFPPTSEKIHAHAFQVFRRAMDDEPSHYNCPTIPPEADSSHVTGYHSAEGMSRYNTYREGLVFSDGNFVGNDEVQKAMRDMFDSLHAIAQQVLTALEQHWKLPDGWFQNTLGPTENHSQWHMKRYVLPEQTSFSLDKSDGPAIWLPVHTDPSLISVVIHDIPGVCEGAMGLEYQTDCGDWKEVPQSGHGSATIFVGSVLSYITGGKIKAAKHRVLYTRDEKNIARMAATLFVRPRGTAQLVVPPCPRFQDVTLKKQTTFDTWNSRVSRNYMKKKQQKSKISCVTSNEKEQKET